MPGCGRNRATRVLALYKELLPEYVRIRTAKVKTSPAVLRVIAISLIQKAEAVSPFSPSVQINGSPLASKITTRWIQDFMDCNNFVIRRQTGKLAVSPEKQLHIERSIAYHLGQLKRGVESGELEEDYIENADETHFVFNMDNGRIIGFRRDENVKNADVVSGDEGITMMVRITGAGMRRSSPQCWCFRMRIHLTPSEVSRMKPQAYVMLRNGFLNIEILKP